MILKLISFDNDIHKQYFHTYNLHVRDLNYFDNGQNEQYFHKLVLRYLYEFEFIFM